MSGRSRRKGHASLASSHSLSPKERTLRARIAAHSLHAQGKTNTGPARAAFDSKWEQQVDPDCVLSHNERARRAAHAKRAHFQRLALRSAKRRRKQNGKAEAA